MATTLVEFLLEDLEKVLSCSTDFILAEKDEIQSLSEELKFIRAFLLLHDAQDKSIDHQELKNLVAHIREVSCEALALFDFSTLVAIEKKKSAKARKILRDCSPDLKIYLKERISWARILKQFSPGTMTHVQDVAGNLLYDVQSIDVSDLTENNESTSAQIVHVFGHSQKLAKFTEKVTSIKKAVIEIGSKELYDIGLPDIEVLSFSEASTSRACSNCLDDEDIMVGLDDEALKIKERLVGDQKQLEIISVVGMAGIGKTTLARKLYNDPLIVYRFHIRGWTYVSQVYQKHDLLLRILSFIVENEDDLNSFDKERLGEELHRRLKGSKYLIVVDDIWNIEAWEDLRKCFPNDNNGSRIMLTTRLKDVALHINPQSLPHCLSFLSQDESWDLLQRKVFGKGNSCSPELMEVGKQIAVKCQGLPLAIVVVGGLLSKNEKKQNWWEEVAKHMSSYMTGAAEEFMDVLELSYTHLPQHLKSCFQYFGAFPEDYEIPVWRLALLWIAEGFLEQTGEKSLELVAEDYLTDLIDRSLVIVSERRSRGGVKVCHIHDMLRDLCLRKANEKNFLQQIDWYGRVASPSTPILHDIMCFHSHGFHSISGKICSPNVISLFSYAPTFQRTHHPGRSMSCIYIVLRVLSLWCVYLNNFPDEILQLFHLRYLELHVRYLDSLPQQISNLWNLETLVIDKGEWGPVSIPHSVWNMVKLRHIRISDEIKFQKPCANHGYPSVLNSLQSLSALPLSRSSEDTEFVLARTPNLKKMAFYRGPNELETFSLPNLSYLSHVDTLKLLENSVWGASQLRIPQPSSFPPNLKKLTLSGGHGDWKEISKLGKLPNLEVLKLRRNFFSGPSWKTSDGEFLQLKYLKLSSMDLQKWITSAGHFPNLQQLVLHGCMVLEEIPSCLGDIPTLQIIEISWSSQSASNSVFRIQEEQCDNGNDGLKVSVHHPNEYDENNASEDDSEVCTLQ